MQNFIIELGLNCLVCYGARFAFQFGALSPIKNAYEAIGEKIAPKLFDYLSNPLWDCVMCMSSIWGIGFLLVVGPNQVTGYSIISAQTVIYVFALCGLNWLVSHLLEYLASRNNEFTVKEKA